MVFQHTDKLFYVAVYTDGGDFSKLSEKGYETAKEAGDSVGFPEGTPTGELVQDDEVVEASVVKAEVETPAESTEEKVEKLEDEVDALKEEVKDLAEDVNAPAVGTAPEVAPVTTEAPVDTVKTETTPEEVVVPAEVKEEVTPETDAEVKAEVVAPAEDVIA